MTTPRNNMIGLPAEVQRHPAYLRFEIAMKDRTHDSREEILRAWSLFSAGWEAKQEADDLKKKLAMWEAHDAPLIAGGG